MSRKPRPAAPTPSAPPARRSRRAVAAVALVALSIAVLAFAAATWIGRARAPVVAVPAALPAATFVGAGTCAGCHAPQATAWRGSQHAHAMQPATGATVLGDFAGARFRYGDVVSTFSRRGDRFVVNTDGADGKLADFEVRYTFGVYPLQQYLVAFPDGRLQALSIAWDARPRGEGGQRWFHLYPGEHVAAGDPLHWTRLNQNWNWMCADCHTTDLRRGYDAATDRYDTRWAEGNVACEACHGPGSRHVAWARAPAAHADLPDRGLVVALDERHGVAWMPDPRGTARRSVPRTTQRELGVCAQCHSRRAPLAAGMAHDGRLYDTHDLSLLDEEYFPDGQQRGEVYDVGSFLQSRMHAAGVSCSDCHEPHSGKLRAPGNAVCAQCHAPAKFDVAQHTLHATGSAGAQCAACHLPTRTYMGVDARHDHSIRIPRPDLATTLGTPDACSQCHRDRTPAWAADAIARHFGPRRKGFQTFGPALHAARTGAADAPAQLLAVLADPAVPAIARASVLAELATRLDARSLPAIEAALRDPDPMVRGAALEALLPAPPDVRLRLASPLLGDASRIVRIKAARTLAVAPPDAFDASTTRLLQSAFAEYEQAQMANADRPEARVNLGQFHAERGDAAAAEADYRAALRLQPDFLPAHLDLADLYRATQRDADAEAALDAGLRVAPDDADLREALGLLRVRQGRLADALPHLRHAARAAPDNARFALVYGVALHDAGQRGPARTELAAALARHPADASLLGALAGYAREAGDDGAAAAYEHRLVEATAAGP